MADSNNNGKDKNKERDGIGNNADPKEEVAITRLPRGRPRGSKNKPKLPMDVTEDIPNVFQSHLMEFASGVNIAESLLHFSKTSQMGLCVLSATGAVINVTLRKVPGAIILLHGRFDIISLSGSFLPLGPTPLGLPGLTILLAGSDKKQVIGGPVVGPLMASGPVMVMVATFSSAIYERLPLPIEENDKEESSGCDSFGDSGVSMLGMCGSCGQQQVVLLMCNI